MAQYKVKKGYELTSICIGKRQKLILCECDQSQLQDLYNKGWDRFIEKEEEKKESKKVSKKESLEDEQGE